MLISTFIDALESVKTKMINKEQVTVLEHIIIELVKKVNMQDIGDVIEDKINGLLQEFKQEERLIMHIASKEAKFTNLYSRSQSFCINTSRGESITFKVIDNIKGIISSNSNLIQTCDASYDKCILSSIVEACEDKVIYDELLDGFQDRVETNTITTIKDVDEFFEKADEFGEDFLVLLPDRQAVAVYEADGELVVQAYLGEQAKFKETDASIFNVIF